MGIKSPDKIAVPSVRNDLAFLVTVTREWQQGGRATDHLRRRGVSIVQGTMDASSPPFLIRSINECSGRRRRGCSSRGLGLLHQL